MADDDEGRTGPEPADEPRPEEAVAEAIERIGRAATEIAETVVGLGVLGGNRLPVLRRDLMAQAARREEDAVPDPDLDRDPPTDP